MNYIYQFFIACIPAVISGFVTYSKTKSDSKIKLRELEQKLTEQSNNHKHELEQMKQAHEHQLELLQAKALAEQESKEKEVINSIAAPIAQGLFGNMLKDVKNPQDFKKKSKQINDMLK
ncbi:hypothetical protein [Lactococcus lactis]|uniref:hypothetical protein n=1 Tax=Lactococcus lactis TaxID=1358 RepID=UPI0035BBF2FC